MFIQSLMLIGVGIIEIDGLYNFFKTDHSLLVPVDFLRIWLGVRWAWGKELAFLYLHVVYPRLLQLWSCNNVVSSLQFILYKYYYSDANYPIPGWFCAKQWVSAIFLLSFRCWITIPFDGLVPLIVSPCIDFMIEYCLLTLLATCYHIIGV